MQLVAIYLAGFLATATMLWIGELSAPARQRLPVRNRLTLSALWPLFVAFLACAWVAVRRDRSTSSG